MCYIYACRIQIQQLGRNHRRSTMTWTPERDNIQTGVADPNAVISPPPATDGDQIVVADMMKAWLSWSSKLINKGY